MRGHFLLCLSYSPLCRSCSVSDFIIWILFLLISKKLFAANTSNHSMAHSCPIKCKKNLCELISKSTSYSSGFICVNAAWIAPNCTCLVRSVDVCMIVAVIISRKIKISLHWMYSFGWWMQQKILHNFYGKIDLICW